MNLTSVLTILNKLDNQIYQKYVNITQHWLQNSFNFSFHYNQVTLLSLSHFKIIYCTGDWADENVVLAGETHYKRMEKTVV